MSPLKTSTRAIDPPADAAACCPLPRWPSANARAIGKVSVGLLWVGALFAVTACVGGVSSRALAVDQRALVAGTVAGVDLSPMAYDGDALVVVSTATHGRVTVHLPARRNLCQAQGFDLLTELRAGDAVQAEGTASGPSDLHLCRDARDALRRQR